MKEIREEIPPEVSESDSFKVVQAQVEYLLHISGALASEGCSLRPPEPTRELKTQSIGEASIENNGSSVRNTQSRVEGGPGMPHETASARAQREVFEQFEPGVYVTLLQLPNGTKFFKRIRFRYARLPQASSVFIV